MSQFFYVDKDGNYLGSWVDAEDPPEPGLISVPAPDSADQIWQFPGWSSSDLLDRMEEDQWRASEMPKAQMNITSIEYGADDIPGTAAQWKAYWLGLRKWTEENPDFPDSSKRPVPPN
ncbi:hypothetical protein [Pseudomonas costantinii]|uniref:Uncharacterized protein n=1 Tax=Pseudomonas costantinii TaxID=168469 RepID=A0A1S2UIG4_9PSED|nr:hypothetical protein [Pseudomonas costantinii]OIN45960.1 hypothetical protein BFL40_27370 [Pseudomonas costantinii]SEE54448.1 hypothetical protein SAMN04515675_6155 [Pseudomonas costantinii]